MRPHSFSFIDCNELVQCDEAINVLHAKGRMRQQKAAQVCLMRARSSRGATQVFTMLSKIICTVRADSSSPRLRIASAGQQCVWVDLARGPEASGDRQVHAALLTSELCNIELPIAAVIQECLSGNQARVLGSRSGQDVQSRRPSLIGIAAIEQFDKAALPNICIASSLHHCCSLLDVSVCGLCGVQTHCE